MIIESGGENGCPSIKINVGNSLKSEPKIIVSDLDREINAFGYVWPLPSRVPRLSLLYNGLMQGCGTLS